MSIFELKLTIGNGQGIKITENPQDFQFFKIFEAFLNYLYKFKKMRFTKRQFLKY
ncbi:hypothetical protein MSIBF_A1460021 [groundwater metagenome]|uniref:Uncharacterized protein n=1 Tax=groundwater metagenome TaxID=717931 RepID=A0A098E6C1_9ZZZZ